MRAVVPASTRNAIRRCCALAFLVLAVGQAIPAQESQALVVGTSADAYPPFVFEDGEGFSRTLAERLATDLGFSEVRIVTFAWPQLEERLAAGDFTLAMGGITWRAERSVVGWMSRALAAGGPCVVGDWDGERWAVNRGGFLESWARERYPERELIAVNDNTELPELLAHHTVDAFVTDSFEVAHFARASDPRRCEPAAERKVVWVAPHAIDLGPRVDAWIDAHEDWLREQRERYFGAPMPRDDLDHLLDLLARRLALMPHVARFKAQRGTALEDPKREAAVLASVGERAEQAGLDPASTRALFALQIELAKALQERSSAEKARTTRDLDLELELRPAISRLGERIVAALAEVAPVPKGALDDPERWVVLDPWLAGAHAREALRSALLTVERSQGSVSGAAAPVAP
jgi:chorismate mutase-like protein